MLDQHRDYVLRTVEERGVRLVRLWFTDVLGNLKSFAISPAELENALEDGMTFDGSSIDGFSRVQETDVLAIPDPEHVRAAPVGRPRGSPRRGCSATSTTSTARRSRAIRARSCAATCGPPTSAGSRSTSRPTSSSSTSSHPSRARRRARSTTAASSTSPPTTWPATCASRRSARSSNSGIPVEYSFHEDAPSQQEIDLRHTDALTMADSVMTFRLVVKEVAASEGVHATFMPKPLEGVQGSGMHIHMSLFRGDENAFYDPDDPHNLSPVAKAFMAGLLRHAAEITAITNQTVNSYKRLVPGFEAPVHVSWARNNRSGLIRVPIPKKASPNATRIEYRSPDPACNPYLAFSLILAAGLRGITEGYELPAEADANLFEMGDDVLAKLGDRRSSRSRCPTR